MTPIAHFHAETQVLPVRDHLSLLSSQFLARALQPTHPSHSLITSPPGPRNMKHTLQSLFLHRVAPYTVDGTIPPDTYRHTINSLHTDAVSQAVASLPDNTVLGAAAPPVAPEESSLPRSYRTTLSQLRSGYCSSLNSFLERVGRAPSDRCPSCGSGPHTTAHVFSCPSHPTPLGLRDLWDRPCLTASFVSSLPFFVLPALPRPPPEPPPP